MINSSNLLSQVLNSFDFFDRSRSKIKASQLPFSQRQPTCKIMETNKPNSPKDINNKSTEDLAREARITKEDLEALGPEDDNLRNDGGDDDQLLKRVRKVDFSGDDLDVPGSELDDEQEQIGSEDEENNSYSNANDEQE